MSADAAQVGVVAADWTQLLARRDKNAPPSPYFAKVATVRGRAEAPGSEPRPVVAFRDRLKAAAPGRRPALVRSMVRETSLRVLRIDRGKRPGRWRAAF